jgi:predicted nucleotidyltransferase
MTKNYIRKIILDNKQILKKYKVKSFLLFGSYLRNKQRKDSDIDLLVEFDKKVTLYDFVGLEDELSGIFKKKVSIVSRRGLNKYIGPYILKEAELIGEKL